MSIGGVTKPQRSMKYLILVFIFSFLHFSSVSGFRNDDNSDHIDDLRDCAEDYRNDAKDSFGDFVRDVVSGDWANAPVDAKDFIDSSREAEKADREANVLEYCPEGYNDPWKP